ncbi:Hypothetical_protein [Hexamita inflata]|uniref:Hypothetical_protein n=1 Tax=Hexamita inflata TaxID=28002 RepID=A0AA86NWU1_9EUKA|nr:Hypothetical protein HINF_LOCUS14959 [Hexamita inflata]
MSNQAEKLEKLRQKRQELKEEAASTKLSRSESTNILQLSHVANKTNTTISSFKDKMKTFSNIQNEQIQDDEGIEIDLPTTDVKVRELMQKFASQPKDAKNRIPQDLLEILDQSTERPLQETAKMVLLNSLKSSKCAESPYRKLDQIQNQGHFSKKMSQKPEFNTSVKASKVRFADEEAEEQEPKKKIKSSQSYLDQLYEKKPKGGSSPLAQSKKKVVQKYDSSKQKNVEDKLNNLINSSIRSECTDQEHDVEAQEPNILQQLLMGHVDQQLNTDGTNLSPTKSQKTVSNAELTEKLTELKNHYEADLKMSQQNYQKACEDYLVQKERLVKSDSQISSYQQKIKQLELENKNLENMVSLKDQKIQVLVAENNQFEKLSVNQARLLDTYNELEKPAFILFNIFSRELSQENVNSKGFKTLKAARNFLQKEFKTEKERISQLKTIIGIAKIIANDGEKAELLGEPEIYELFERYLAAKQEK